jgi:hypothetical protein
MAADSATMAIVAGVTVPLARSSVPPYLLAGSTKTVQPWTSVSHHELFYLNYKTGKTAGPFSLNDAPSLARSTAVATSDDLFLWTIANALPGTVAPDPNLSIYPLGSSSPRLVVPSPGPWPVSGEPTAPLPSGDAVRLLNGTQLAQFSAETGQATITDLSQQLSVAAAPSAPGFDLQANGTLLVTNPQAGRAVVISQLSNPGTGQAGLTLPAPGRAAAALGHAAALAPDGDTVYASGTETAGGLVAYSTSTGHTTAVYSNGQTYTGVYAFDSAVVATSASAPQITVLSPELQTLQTSSTAFHVVGIY